MFLKIKIPLSLTIEGLMSVGVERFELPISCSQSRRTFTLNSPLNLHIVKLSSQLKYRCISYCIWFISYILRKFSYNIYKTYNIMDSKKRKFGSSSLQQRKDGFWLYHTYTYYNTTDGKKKPLSKYLGKLSKTLLKSLFPFFKWANDFCAIFSIFLTL